MYKIKDNVFNFLSINASAQIMEVVEYVSKDNTFGYKIH